MSVLVLAEHDHASLKPSTLKAVTAALKLDADVHVLIAGHNAGEAAKQAAAVAGVKKVLHADAGPSRITYLRMLRHWLQVSLAIIRISFPLPRPTARISCRALQV